MRFFTPERYLRLGILNSEQAFRAAHEEWEQALEKYQAHLNRIRPELPASLRRLVARVYLHDARILDMWQARVNRFTITLHPESDPSRLVVLTYSLDKPPEVRQRVLPAESCSEPIAWLYDELDLKRPASGNGRRGHRPQRKFVHDILLSNGWEIRLHFHAVKVTRPEAIIPGAAAASDRVHRSA